MPEFQGLTTEHIKSHLQKYRVHKARSRDEFREFFQAHLLEPYRAWEKDRGKGAAEYLQSLTEVRSSTLEAAGAATEAGNVSVGIGVSVGVDFGGGELRGKTILSHNNVNSSSSSSSCSGGDGSAGAYQ